MGIFNDLYEMPAWVTITIGACFALIVIPIVGVLYQITVSFINYLNQPK